MGERTESKIRRTTQVMRQLADFDVKEFLEKVPLYVWQQFGKPNINRRSLWIREIDAFCETCGQLRPFQAENEPYNRFEDVMPPLRGGGIGATDRSLKTGTSYFKFTCVSCKKETREFHVEQIVDGETIRFQKYGERPRKRLARDPVLQRFLKDDLDNYEKAVVCLSSGYGIAAFAYFRRVVENNINRLLELVQEEANSSGADPKVVAALAELQKNSSMTEKIRIANRALPATPKS